MKLRLYVLRDNLADDATPPMAFPNDDVARRTFESSMSNNPNVADFDLFCIGVYNSSTLSIESLSVPSLVDTNEEKTKILEISRSHQERIDAPEAK